MIPPRLKHSGTYRPQLWHIPSEVFCSMHHLSNNPIHFLFEKQLVLVLLLIWHNTLNLMVIQPWIESTAEPDFLIWSWHSHFTDFLNNLQSCRGLHCHLCHRAWKRLKREGNWKWKCWTNSSFKLCWAEKKQRTHTPTCPWAAHPPAERSSMKHPSERLPLQESRRRETEMAVNTLVTHITYLHKQ